MEQIDRIKWMCEREGEIQPNQIWIIIIIIISTHISRRKWRRKTRKLTVIQVEFFTIYSEFKKENKKKFHWHSLNVDQDQNKVKRERK